MADNISIGTFTGGSTVATDNVGDVHFEKMKVNLGGVGVDGATWDGKEQGGTLAVVTSVSNLAAGTITKLEGGTITMTATGKDTFASLGTFTITLAALASSAVGVGRQSVLIDNTANRFSEANIYCKFTVGTPTANTLIYVYLLRRDNVSLADDNAGTGDASLTVVNAPLLGNVLVSGTTVNAAYSASFNTRQFGALGPQWGVAVVNSSGATLNGTAGSHSITYVGINPSLT